MSSCNQSCISPGSLPTRSVAIKKTRKQYKSIFWCYAKEIYYQSAKYEVQVKSSCWVTPSSLFKGRDLHTNRVTHSARAQTGLYRSFTHPPPRIWCYSSTIPHPPSLRLFVGTHLHLWVERGIVGANNLLHDHNVATPFRPRVRIPQRYHCPTTSPYHNVTTAPPRSSTIPVHLELYWCSRSSVVQTPENTATPVLTSASWRTGHL